MNKKKYTIDQAVEDVGLKILVYKIQEDQARLFQDLINPNINLDYFFNKQNDLNKRFIESSVSISWEHLKKNSYDIYEHERKHAIVWENNEVEFNLFKVEGTEKNYAVVDLNFSEIVKEKNLSKEKVIQIYKNMLIAPTKNEEKVKFEDLSDIFFYEVLNGMSDLWNKEERKKILGKYTWN